MHTSSKSILNAFKLLIITITSIISFNRVYGQSDKLRMNKHLITDYKVTAAASVAYLAQGYGKSGIIQGLTIASEAKVRYDRSYTFQFTLFRPFNKEFSMPLYNKFIDPGSTHTSDEPSTYQKATLHNVMGSLSFGRKVHLTGDFNEDNGIYICWDLGLGFSYTYLSSAHYDANKYYAPHQLSLDGNTSITLQTGAGAGYKKKFKNFDFFWEAKGNLFLDPELLDDNVIESLDEPIYHEGSHLKTNLNFIAINFGVQYIF